MSKASPVAEALVAVADAVHDLRRDARVLHPPPKPGPVVFPPTRESDLRLPRWMGIALRLCVDRDAGTCLAQQVKPVPAEYVDGDTIRCVCGASHERAELVECPGACGRFFFGDTSGVWAWKVPAEQPDEPHADPA